MWGAAIVVFREVFEIAIILCVVLAATKDVVGRGKWISAGIAAGAVGATLFGIITESLSILTQGSGQLYFNAAVLFSAVLMIAWTVIWMKQHSKTIVTDLKQVGKDISLGTKPVHMLAVVIGLAVLREGSEIVVFIYGLIAANQATLSASFLGSFIGLGLGIVFGMLLYYGLLRLSIKYLFQVTSILLTLIAAGMAANAAGKLVSAGVLPILIDSLWNTSAILPQHGWIGRFLFVLVGYQENPNGMQGLFYFVTVVGIYLATKRKASSTSVATAKA